MLLILAFGFFTGLGGGGKNGGGASGPSPGAHSGKGGGVLAVLPLPGPRPVDGQSGRALRVGAGDVVPLCCPPVVILDGGAEIGWELPPSPSLNRWMCGQRHVRKRRT